MDFRTGSAALLALTAMLGACTRYDDFAAYEQLLPRGEIAPILEPAFVTADEAGIDDDSFVLGVVVEGQPRAYSLNLLNAHEVVNDRAGGTSFAAVW
mgnify:CR=1 FL=1